MEGNIPWRKRGGDGGAMKNTSSVYFNRAGGQFKEIYDLFENANRVLQRGQYIKQFDRVHQSRRERS